MRDGTVGSNDSSDLSPNMNKIQARSTITQKTPKQQERLVIPTKDNNDKEERTASLAECRRLFQSCPSYSTKCCTKRIKIRGLKNNDDCSAVYHTKNSDHDYDLGISGPRKGIMVN